MDQVLSVQSQSFSVQWCLDILQQIYRVRSIISPISHLFEVGIPASQDFMQNFIQILPPTLHYYLQSVHFFLQDYLPFCLEVCSSFPLSVFAQSCYMFTHILYIISFSIQSFQLSSSIFLVIQNGIFRNCIPNLQNIETQEVPLYVGYTKEWSTIEWTKRNDELQLIWLKRGIIVWRLYLNVQQFGRREYYRRL